MNTKKLPESHYEQTLSLFKRQGFDIIKEVKQAAESLRKSEEDMDDLVFNLAASRITGSASTHTGIQNPAALAQAKTSRELMFHTYHFSKLKKIYRMEEAITAKLLHTNLSKVDSLFLKAPHKEVYLDLPYNQTLVIPGERGDDFRVKGIYIHVEEDMDIRGLRSSEKSVLNEDSIDPAFLFDGVAIDKKLKILAVGEGSESYRDTLFFGTFFFAPGDIFPQIEAAIEKWTLPGASGVDNKVYLRKLFSFILNSLLYVTSGSSSLMPLHAKFASYPKGKKSKRIATDLKNKGLSKINQVSVGSDIYLSKEFREHYRAGSLSERYINCPKWVVQGHWRNQPYGLGRKQIRLKWIEPYEKGKGISEDIKPKNTVVG